MKRVLAILVCRLGVLTILIFSAEPLRADPITITPMPTQVSVLEGLPAAFKLIVTNTSTDRFITINDIFALDAVFLGLDRNDEVSVVKTTDVGCLHIRLGPNGTCTFLVTALTQDLQPERSDTIEGLWRIPVFATGNFDNDSALQIGRTDVFVIVQDPVPEPATLLLFSTGLTAVAVKMRKRLKRAR